MMTERLYEVTVTVKMYVIADSPQKAQQFAKDNYEEERYTARAVATPITNCPAEVKNSLAWGVGHNDPRQDWTLQQWLGHIAERGS